MNFEKFLLAVGLQFEKLFLWSFMRFEKFFLYMNLLFSSGPHVDIPDLSYWWLFLAFFFLIMEIGHPGLFFFLSFFVGGLSAFVSSLRTDSVSAQILIFFISTIIALFILRYWGITMMGKNRPYQQTNFYALKGKRAVVTQTIMGENAGLVNIGGHVWAARSVHYDEAIISGEVVEVVDVRGAHVVVKKV
jgi:membrane protein implicated in regulation of membrane protease activity